MIALLLIAIWILVGVVATIAYKVHTRESITFLDMLIGSLVGSLLALLSVLIVGFECLDKIKIYTPKE